MASDDSTSAASHGQGLHDTTSSRCRTETFTATHNFEVADFSLLDGMGIGEFVRSSTFTVGGCDWNIRLFPDGNKKEHEGAFVSVFLCFIGGGEATRVRAKFSLSMVDRDSRVSKLPMLGDDRPLIHTFGPGDREWSWGVTYIEKFKLRHFLYLNDDSLTIRCVLSSSPELKM